MAVLALVAAAGASWWSGRGSRVEVRTAAVREVTGPAAASTVLNASGYVTARLQATVASKITGRLTEVRVEEGLPVEKGRLLARLDDSQLQAVLSLAEAQALAARRAVTETERLLELARLTLQRSERLVRDGVESEASLDADRTNVESLEARLELRRQEVVVADRQVNLRRAELDDTRILAPFDGIVISKDANPGEMVSPISAGGGFTRTGICTLVDMTSLEIEVDVNESYISRVRDGQQVRAVLDAYPDWQIPAHVITTIPAADRQKATVLVRIGFDETDPRILPDMGVKVAFRGETEPHRETPRPRLVVPSGALRRDGGRDVVLIARDGVIERRAVSIGGELDGSIVLDSGVSPGERVVVDGPEGLTDGQKVVE